MERVEIPPLMIVPLAIAHSTIIKGGYPEVSLRLMLWRKGEMLWRKEKMLWRRGLWGGRGLRGESQHGGDWRVVRNRTGVRFAQNHEVLATERAQNRE